MTTKVTEMTLEELGACLAAHRTTADPTGDNLFRAVTAEIQRRQAVALIQAAQAQLEAAREQSEAAKTAAATARYTLWAAIGAVGSAVISLITTGAVIYWHYHP
jgi:hypothetical protein